MANQGEGEGVVTPSAGSESVGASSAGNLKKNTCPPPQNSFLLG